MPKLRVCLTVQREDPEGTAPGLVTLAEDRHEFADPAEAHAFAERVRAWIGGRPHPDDELANGAELLHYYGAQNGRRRLPGTPIAPDAAWPELARTLELEEVPA